MLIDSRGGQAAGNFCADTLGDLDVLGSLERGDAGAAEVDIVTGWDRDTVTGRF
jgi:hypothetical protein